MKKKTTNSEVQLNWNPSNKEPWHLEFDKELVNDEKWTCIVAAVVPFQVEDEECIQMFSQSVATGLRKSIIVITAADIIRILQEQGTHSGKGKIEKKSKDGKIGKNYDVQNPGEVEAEKKKRVKPPLPRASPIVNLVAKYSTITETEVKSPPDLMASIIKYAILNIKDENVFWKKVDAVKKRKMRERSVKVNFIKSVKPFNAKPGESFGKDKNQSDKPELINDEPHPGPDLYIVLKDFFDPFYFPELLKINVPFMALLKISHFKEMTPAKFSQAPLTNLRTDAFGRKEALISTFWKILAENCSDVDKTTLFKDFAFMEYQPQMPKMTESKHYVSDVIFDEVSWMLYSVFTIHRQHEAYLREMHVQRMIVALEPLDLSACNVYNRICDGVISTEPCAILFVIFAIVEQVAVGVPSTKNRVFCYESKPSQYFFNAPNSRLRVNPEGDDLKFINKMNNITSCLSCNQNKINHSELICRHLSDKMPPMTNVWSEEIDETIKKVPRKINNEMNGTDYSGLNADRSLLPSDRGTKEKTSEDFWTNSDLCFYGDKLTLHTYHSDFSLVDLNLIVNRFFKNTDLLQIWCKYPKLSPEKKAFYNFHFLRLLQITKCDKELLKKKIFFLLAMKLIGITKSYLFKGEEENLSDLFRTPSRDRTKKFSKVKFNPHGDIRQESQGDRNFTFCFFRLFNPNANGPKRVTVKTENAREVEKPKNSFLKADSVILRKVTSIFNMSLVTHRNSGYCFSYFLKPTDLETASSPFNLSPMDQEFSVLYSLLDCYEISSLLESHMLNNSDDYVNLVKNFNFFEVLESQRMVQRLLEAQEAFNTTQCSYFAPTDTLIVILHNESDHRGVFYTCGYGSLLTPVCLRDFYAHVYPEISEWLAIEKHEYIKFVTKVDENTKELELKNSKECLSQLKRKFKAMSEAEKKKFLNEDIRSLEFRNQEEIEVVEDELEDLPSKIKPDYPRKLSFIGTNFSEVRIETERRVHEFHSRDTTRINLHIDSWLHESNRLLTLEIQQSVFRFWYHQWLGKEPNTLFTLKTTSDTIFVFHKESTHQKMDTRENYHVKISLPTGLIIQGIFDDVSNVYIKQNYLTVYKKWWNLEKEKCRRFLKNGQILIFKQDEQVEVLCASGTKHIMEKSSSKRKEGSIRCFETFQTVTMTGQVWEINNIGRGHYQNRRKLVDHMKVLIGVDPKTKETYYRRDDGVTCMLWPDGKLVTNFPDGTKITSTPDFDPTEVIIEWTEEEQIYFELLKSNQREEMTEQRPKSKTILKKTSPDSIPELPNTSLLQSKTSFLSDGFLSVSVSYLMEHPKYSTVYYDFRCSKVEIKMPSNLSIHIHLDGTYLISRENNFFAVQPDSAELYTVCTGCGEKSSATIYFDSGQTLCEFVDLLRTTFYVYRNGEVMHHDQTEKKDFKNLSDCTLNKSHNFPCKFDHNKSVSGKQRCFALERDLSGTEFLHNESLARDFYQLPRDTHYNLHRENETNSILTHLFSIPYYRAGHESWTMDYEVHDNSTPTNLNKNDLNELGTKNDSSKLYKYPFSRNQSTECKNRCRKLNDKPKKPKLVVIRVVKCLSENPKTVIDELKTHIGIYQRKAHDLFKMYKKNKSIAECLANNSKQIKKNLKKISLPPDRWWVMSPHISTEMDIHFSGHYFNLIDELYTNIPKNWPQCKQSANFFLTNSGVLTVHEGVEFQREA